MREIKFRGKSLLTGKWVFGSYIKTDFCISGVVISNGNGFGHTEVEPETIGQFTGLKDSKGVEIYEGDVVQFEDDNIDYFFVVSMLDNGCFMVHDKYNVHDRYFLDDFDYLVIGNIY